MIFNRRKLPLTTQKIKKFLLQLNPFNKAVFKKRLSTLTSSGGCMSSQASTWHCIIFQTQHNRRKRGKKSKLSTCHVDLQITWQANTIRTSTEKHLYYNKDLKICDLDHSGTRSLLVSLWGNWKWSHSLFLLFRWCKQVFPLTKATRLMAEQSLSKLFVSLLEHLLVLLYIKIFYFCHALENEGLMRLKEVTVSDYLYANSRPSRKDTTSHVLPINFCIPHIASK